MDCKAKLNLGNLVRRCLKIENKTGLVMQLSARVLFSVPSTGKQMDFFCVVVACSSVHKLIEWISEIFLIIETSVWSSFLFAVLGIELKASSC